MADSDNESRGHNNSNAALSRALPGNAKISKDAKETVQECVSEFIRFIFGEASDKCQGEKHKTINGDDLLWAMTTLSFEEYVEPLKIYLQKFREMEGEKGEGIELSVTEGWKQWKWRKWGHGWCDGYGKQCREFFW